MFTRFSRSVELELDRVARFAYTARPVLER
jgi:hypothetical protein